MRSLIALATGIALSACSQPYTGYVAPAPAAPSVTVAAQAPPASNLIRAPLVSSIGGTPRVNVAIDGVCCFPFVVDSGASDVSVSPALFKAMVKGGHIGRENMIDVVRYQTANGMSEGLRFRMPPMTVAGKTVYDVVGSVSPDSNMLLLGQSFLKRFRFYAIDPHNNVLILGN